MGKLGPGAAGRVTVHDTDRVQKVIRGTEPILV
jgi:hypothetical protein